MPSPIHHLRELRQLAERYGLPLETLDRLSLRPREVARGTGFSSAKISDWIADGRLPSVKIDGSVAVLMVDLLNFLERHRRVTTSQKESPRARALRILGEVP